MIWVETSWTTVGLLLAVSGCVKSPVKFILNIKLHNRIHSGAKEDDYTVDPELNKVIVEESAREAGQAGRPSFFSVIS